MAERYLGSWVLPSGNSCCVYLSGPLPEKGIRVGGLMVAWDRPPSRDWPAEDIAHWYVTTLPEIARAVAMETGLRVLAVPLR